MERKTSPQLANETAEVFSALYGMVKEGVTSGKEFEEAEKRFLTAVAAQYDQCHRADWCEFRTWPAARFVFGRTGRGQAYELTEQYCRTRLARALRLEERFPALNECADVERLTLMAVIRSSLLYQAAEERDAAVRREGERASRRGTGEGGVLGAIRDRIGSMRDGMASSAAQRRYEEVESLSSPEARIAILQKLLQELALYSFDDRIMEAAIEDLRAAGAPREEVDWQQDALRRSRAFEASTPAMAQ